MAREINLVPDIKDEMNKTLKLRNLIFFICIIASIAGISISLITGLIMGGQQLALDSKKNTLDNLSGKLGSFADLSDYLTIKDQVSDSNTLADNKQLLSRTFNILTALLPTGADTITISELNINLAGEQPTLTFDAQANAGTEPYIDYNVLDSFKKSMDYMRYDYGEYVDKNGNPIPAYCMTETNTDGSVFNDPDKGIYAYWDIKGIGCNPSEELTSADYDLEGYEDKQMVRIWRTPQYRDWYHNEEEGEIKEDEPNITLDGTITGVPHFESQCITYTGSNAENPSWVENNDSCALVVENTSTDEEGELLVADGAGIVITESSNGRDANDELVLRFSAVITIAPEAYKFSNHHLLAFGPSDRHNVTDSYVQIQAMFGKRATDCSDDDATCSSAPTENNNNNSNNNNSNDNNNRSNNQTTDDEDEYDDLDDYDIDRTGE